MFKKTNQAIQTQLQGHFSFFKVKFFGVENIVHFHENEISVPSPIFGKDIKDNYALTEDGGKRRFNSKVERSCTTPFLPCRSPTEWSSPIASGSLSLHGQW